MHIGDFQDSIARGHIRTIEDAFRALVGWPDEDTIHGSSAASRAAMLEPICKALRDDDSIVPGNLHETIAEAAGEPVGPTYRECAAAVLNTLPDWQELVRRAD